MTAAAVTAARPADAEKMTRAGRMTGTQKTPCDDTSSHGAFQSSLFIHLFISTQ
ncbi:hypothetical protein CLOHYLEM_04883 [[Clostridium] hylemonae DSM 15053]|uniref:Uncharacterized protein n=1 Tax=[Clostridium] hylemonae DSM 15053 TaxID=553973 RepID=C0BYJ4_9FIRM|nr:hypothetical protein CLOHYLEM_04883 [[Clostridium] hylemonae DSM 15053]